MTFFDVIEKLSCHATQNFFYCLDTLSHIYYWFIRTNRNASSWRNIQS